MNDKHSQSNHPSMTQVLRSITQITPDEQTTHTAVAKAIAALTQVDSPPPRRLRFKPIWSRSALAAAIVMLISVLGYLGLDNHQALAAPQWSDVMQLTAKIETTYFNGVVIKDGKEVERTEIWLNFTLPAARTYEYEPVDGKWEFTEASIITSTGVARWDARTKLGEISGPNNPYAPSFSSVQTFCAVLGLSVLNEAPDTKVTIDNDQVNLFATSRKHPTDPTLRGFMLKPLDPNAAALSWPYSTLTYWFEPSANNLKRITNDLGDRGWADVQVTLKPKLQDDWFDLTLPEGIHNVSGDVRSKLSPDVREVYDHIAQARQRFGDYQTVIWRSNLTCGALLREARTGNHWRSDQLNYSVVGSALYTGNNPKGYLLIKPTDDWERIATEIFADTYPVELTAMTWQSKIAVIHSGLTGRGPRTSSALYSKLEHGYDRYFQPTIRQVAWPQWSQPGYHDGQGNNLAVPPLRWTIQPTDPEHPNLVTVIRKRDHNPYSNILDEAHFTFDKDKDWLCVEQVIVATPNHTRRVTVTQTAQTPEGYWYPSQIKVYKNTFDLVVQRHATPTDFFQLPKGVPTPANPMAFMQTNGQAHDNQGIAKQVELPETAKGKYTAFEMRGLPRGFDDKQKLDQHSAMLKNMHRIHDALREYANDHKWQFPDTLQKLVEAGKLEAKDLINPLHPNAKEPFVYIQPNRKLVNRGERVEIYETFEQWPGVIAVMFQDGSIEYVHDMATYDLLMKEAISPEAPSRPYD